MKPDDILPLSKFLKKIVSQNTDALCAYHNAFFARPGMDFRLFYWAGATKFTGWAVLWFLLAMLAFTVLPVQYNCEVINYKSLVWTGLFFRKLNVPCM